MNEDHDTSGERPKPRREHLCRHLYPRVNRSLQLDVSDPGVQAFLRAMAALEYELNIFTEDEEQRKARRNDVCRYRALVVGHNTSLFAVPDHPTNIDRPSGNE